MENACDRAPAAERLDTTRCAFLAKPVFSLAEIRLLAISFPLPPRRSPPRPPLRCFCPTVQPRPYPLAAMGLNQPREVTFWLLREAVDRNFPTHNP